MGKGKFEYWLSEEGLTLLCGLAREGATDADLMERIGIKSSAFYEWKNRFPEFAEAIKKGKEVVDFQVENALLASALAGNTTAQIFWLKNRKPKMWRDHPEAEPSTAPLDRAKEILGGIDSAVD